MNASKRFSGAVHRAGRDWRTGRVRRLLAALGGVLLTGCGYGYGYVAYIPDDCRYPYTVEPAIIVEFVDGADGRLLAVDAVGEIDDGRRREAMSVYRQGEIAGTVLGLAGAYGRSGLFDVSGVVRAAPGATDQPWAFDGVRVRADACGPSTVRLAVVLR